MIVRPSPPPSLEHALAWAARRQRPAAVRLAAAGGGQAVAVACSPGRSVRGDSVEELAACWAEARVAWSAGDHAGIPVAIGYLSYELGRSFERVRICRLHPSPWPLLEFRFYDAFLLLFDDGRPGEIWARDGHAADALTAELLRPQDEPPRLSGGRGSLVELGSAAEHLVAVERALAYIRAGDIYQVNLARRLATDVAVTTGEAPGGALFLRLHEVAPAPYACWLGDADTGTAVVGNSPERFLHRSIDGTVTTCPIKGTRPGGGEGNREALLTSAKDRAEHVMIVDLERNDLGRVCRTGTVEVAELARLLALPTVFHLESTVRGRLRPDIGLPELLRATFPGGSVTGAPKLRAMEIIEELEPARRGPYTGATGWLGAAGDLDLAVAIRTATIRDGRLTLWVGGGIVADSRPAAELAETWDKARAFIRALS